MDIIKKIQSQIKLNESILIEATGGKTNLITLAKSVLQSIPKTDNDDEKFKLASQIADIIPDDLWDDIYDEIKKKSNNITITDEKTISELDELTPPPSPSPSSTKPSKDSLNLKDYLDLVDITYMADSNPDLVKKVVLITLGIISIIEPSPFGEIITLIISALPSEYVAKGLKLLNTVDIFSLLLPAPIAMQLKLFNKIRKSKLVTK